MLTLVSRSNASVQQPPTIGTRNQVQAVSQQPAASNQAATHEADSKVRGSFSAALLKALAAFPV
jgi:hypothetical protein